jgi:hypothetical protein
VVAVVTLTKADAPVAPFRKNSKVIVSLSASDPVEAMVNVPPRQLTVVAEFETAPKTGGVFFIRLKVCVTVEIELVKVATKVWTPGLRVEPLTTVKGSGPVCVTRPSKE